MRHLIGYLVIVCALAAPVCRADGDLLEQFALAEDRAEVLKELIPGTEEYYFYHCLHYQNTGRLDEVEKLLETWIERHKRTDRVREIQNRQALLRYRSDPSGSLEYLRRELGLSFGHEREVLGQESSLPTSLDQRIISRETLTKQALSRSTYRETVQGFEDSALDWLVAETLDAKRRRDLLQRLRRPDYGRLPQLIAKDLDAERSGGFGSIDIHRKLLLSQLEELLQLKPDLLNETDFVNIYLAKLYPNPDVDWRHDEKAREAYLDRLEAFVTRLNPSHNSLKAHVLHQRLVHDRAKRVYDKDRFIAYIKLPRKAVYMRRDYMNRRESQTYAANLRQDFREQTRLPVIGNDEPLIRSYLDHFFVEEDSYKAYETYLDDNYLKEVFAETKILNGLGDMEKWYSWLSPAKYRALKDRIDLDFEPANKRFFDVDEPVSLDLWVKNVETLIVKVFEINTQNYYRRYLREVNTDIDLDGLVANNEEVYTYDTPPLRRAKRHFEFPGLNRRGVYVIEFIGNGKSSRALIRKGRLHYLVRAGVAGHVFTVPDEAKRKVENAVIWLAGHEYRAGEDGTITVPFTDKPGRQPIILSQGEFSSLGHFDHQSEHYSLVAGIHVDRESLRRRKTARVAVRPALYLNGTPVTLSVLEEPTLVIASTDREGISTTKEIRDFRLFEDRVSVHEFRVPDNLSLLAFTLKAKVENISQNEKVDLAASRTFELNQVDKTERTEVLHLSHVDGGYVLELLGKSGERSGNRPVMLAFKHRDFKDEIERTLQTDPEGKIQLGALRDIVYARAVVPDGTAQTWHMARDGHSYPATIHGKAGEQILIPYMGQATEVLRAELSLLEKRGGTYVEDRFEALGITDGFVTMSPLPAGDYELFLKPADRAITIRLTDGMDERGYVLSGYRHLEVKNRKPLQIQGIDAGDERIRVRLANHSAFSRVHVAATRFTPAYSFYADMSTVTFPEPYVRTAPLAESAYIAGRNIGEEYQYILDRKYATKFPGNSLDRPGLLISPWAIRKTETGQQEAAAGEPPQPSAAPSAAKAERAASEKEVGADRTDYANLDFLSGEAVVLLNLEPDEDGVVTIAREDLNGRQQLHIIAVDPANTVYREVSIEEEGIPFLDLRLAGELDPEAHLTEQKQVSFVDAGDELALRDITTSQFEVYDTLAKVYTLFVMLSNNPTLVEFDSITRWPKLTDSEKQEFYSKYASHELNFFIFKKDPGFFAAVVRPFIQNKRDKTFLDQWLVGEDLSPYMKPWAHQYLNIVERILLAEQIEGERSHTARHVADLHNLLPPDIDRFNRLFMTALQGSALDLRMAGGTYGFRKFLVRDAIDEPADIADIEKLRSLGYVEGAGRARAEGSRDLSEVKAVIAPSDVNGRYMFDIGYIAGDVLARARVRQFYKKLDKTEEWVENNYYRLPIEQQNAELVTVNAFWRDYAERDPAEMFVSTNLAEASRNFPEMMFALAALDLPFEAAEHETELDEQSYTLNAASPMIVFHKEIREARAVAEETPILVSQNFFARGDRYRYENNERVDKFVRDEFLTNRVYGCQVGVTNPTSSRHKLDVLLQIPQGAIPVLSGKYTKSVHLDLEPYNTTALEYYFYFPEEGEFEHYPVHVAKNEELIAYAEPATMHVVHTPSTVDKTSWDYTSQHADETDVIEFLNRDNLHRIKLDRIAWRMKDKGFFDAVMDILEQRHAYNPTLWSYALHHNDVPRIRECLQHRNDFIDRCGAYIETELLTIDPVVRKSYQHMEYSPLVNARAHQLGPTRRILNDRFAQQYSRLMQVLTYRARLDHDDLMAVTYYMLLQDRVEEALDFFRRVDRTDLATQLQHDYFTAYLAFCTENLDSARTIVAKYDDYPVERWQKLFANVRSQLAEIDGAEPALIDSESRAQRQAQLAATEPGFEFEVKAKQVTINYQNITECLVNYYLMDIELLFSRNPFVQQYSDQFSTIRPNFSETVTLDNDRVSYAFDLPERFLSSNVMVEIEAGGVKKAQAYYANNLTLQVIENYGQIKVTYRDTGKPLPKVYVKAFARMKNGRVRFYKDGYTDLRGRFDYTSLNTNELDFVDKFALLILSDVDGAVVREANAPKR